MIEQGSSSRLVPWLAWSVLVLAALSGGAWWWMIGRPISLPDAPTSRIACVSYAPFREAGESPIDPKAYVSPQRIDADLHALSQRFDCVRTYSQGQGLAAVPAIASKYGMKVLLGIWIGSEKAANDHEIALGIATARAMPQVVRGVIVGNEVLLRGEQQPQALIGYLRQVRAAIPRTVPVTYADVWEFWLRYPQVAAAVDFITIHVLPYWEDQPVPPEKAIQHLADVRAEVQKAFPGKVVMVGETGWPSAGRPRRAAAASLVNEARYLREFLIYTATTQLPYNVIETFDQPWKRDLEGTVGGYWGIFDVHARPKFPLQGPVIEEPYWLSGLAAGGVGVMLFVGLGLWRRRWSGMSGLSAWALSGFASGTALAWQYRQMYFACRNGWEWLLASLCCLFALFTALRLARLIVARLVGTTPGLPPSDKWRYAWMLILAFYDILMVFDGRYRDFPLGLFALPCIAFVLAGRLGSLAAPAPPRIEERFLAFWMPVLAAIGVVQEQGLNPSAWLWLGLNFAIALPVLRGWRRAVAGHRL